MKKLGIGSLFALAFGLALMLSAAPASAQQIFCGMCTCENSCSDPCIDGPEIPDCPECNESTCGASGPACGGCPPPPDPPDCDLTTTCTRTINGGAGGDTLFGDSRHECINGFGGADTLTGNAGDDTIKGGDGNDSLFGNAGNDCLLGEAGADNATGGSGTDGCDAETEASCEL
jgi:Ca2+-binding RTX toxin-like protein